MGRSSTPSPPVEGGAGPGGLGDTAPTEASLRRTEEALRQANLVVESSAAVLFRWRATPGLPIEYVSGNVTQLGHTVEELLSGRVSWTDVVHPDDRARVIQQIEEHAAGGAEHLQRQYRILTRDGQLRWVEDRIAVQRDARGQLAHYQGIVLDVTERKRADEERGRLQEQLHQASKMESVGRLAGGVAHDVNNMLTAILGHVQLAMEKGVPSVREDLEAIEECALRSAAMVRQLLAFARKQPAAPRLLDLNDTVEGMLQVLRRLIGEDIELAWRPGADLWSVRIDPVQVDQILANLCVNARDAVLAAAPPGGRAGTITIATDDMALDEETCATRPGLAPGQYVVLAVSDNGSGMDRATLERIFEPFFTTKTAGRSTGLGLATVYGIVQQNEGSIEVASEPGEGTTFKIFLRGFTERPAEQPLAAPGELPRSRGGETVLLVEDEGAILRATRAMLEGLGYRVLAASVPGEAVQLARGEAGRISLLLTDVVMPEMNGRALAARVAEIQPGCRCLYSSGYTSDVIAHHGVLDDHVELLQKPFTLRELALRVREAIDRQPGGRP